MREAISSAEPVQVGWPLVKAVHSSGVWVWGYRLFGWVYVPSRPAGEKWAWSPNVTQRPS